METPVVLGSSRLTSYYDNELKKTVNVVILFWSNQTVTWQKEYLP